MRSPTHDGNVTLHENRIGRHDANNTAWHRLRHHRSSIRIRILFGVDRREGTTDGAKHCRPTAVRKTFNAAAGATADYRSRVPLRWRWWQAGWTVDSSRLVSRWLARRHRWVVAGRWLISRGWEPGYTKKLRPLEASKEQSLAAFSDPHSAICHTLPTHTLTYYSNAATLTSQQPDRTLSYTPETLRPRWSQRADLLKRRARNFRKIIKTEKKYIEYIIRYIYQQQ